MKDRKIILASGSPRRIEMMQSHGYAPIICPAKVEENLPVIGGMKETAMFLSLKKAKHVEKNGEFDDGSIIIAADTIVYKDEVMGKPLDSDDCFRMLDALKNDVHYVVTGVAMVVVGAQKTHVFADVTKVFFKDYSDEELRDYLAGNEWKDKAGGYAIQGHFARYVDKIEGDYDNVVGFPWYRIESELKKLQEE